jgi:hypothetical protein
MHDREEKSYKILAGKPEGKRQLTIHMGRWKDNIKTDPTDVTLRQDVGEQIKRNEDIRVELTMLILMKRCIAIGRNE